MVFYVTQVHNEQVGSESKRQKKKIKIKTCVYVCFSPMHASVLKWMYNGEKRSKN